MKIVGLVFYLLCALGMSSCRYWALEDEYKMGAGGLGRMKLMVYIIWEQIKQKSRI